MFGSTIQYLYTVTTKKNKVMAQRYKLSFETLLAACPKWKRTAVLEDIANKKNTGLLTEFIGNVIISAESQDVAAPAVPARRKAARSKIESVDNLKN
jgi:hypothetical protein